MAQFNELQIGLGISKQADIATISGAFLKVNNLSASPAQRGYVTESDAPEIGKGHEFATQIFKSHLGGSVGFEKYLSSEIAAFVLGFGLGNCVKTGTTPNWIYTITPYAPATNGIELPYTSLVEQIRPGGSAVWDVAYVGMMVKSWMISIASGPGRAAAKIKWEMMGSGLYTEPSAVSLSTSPATLHELPASSLTLTINGVDYVTSKNIVSLDMGWDSGVRNTGYYPGSGAQDGFQSQGRIEFGDRVPSFSFVARYNNGSAELTKLKALTTGTAVAVLSASANDMATLTWQKLAFVVAELGDSDGIVTVKVTTIPMYDSTNGVFSAVVKCTTNGICQ